jgi:hypothetical protein
MSRANVKRIVLSGLLSLTWACAAHRVPVTVPDPDPTKPMAILWLGTYAELTQQFTAVCWQEGNDAPVMACLPFGKILEALEEFGNRFPGLLAGTTTGQEARR